MVGKCGEVVDEEGGDVIEYLKGMKTEDDIDDCWNST